MAIEGLCATYTRPTFTYFIKKPTNHVKQRVKKISNVLFGFGTHHPTKPPQPTHHRRPQGGQGPPIRAAPVPANRNVTPTAASAPDSLEIQLIRNNHNHKKQALRPTNKKATQSQTHTPQPPHKQRQWAPKQRRRATSSNPDQANSKKAFSTINSRLR